MKQIFSFQVAAFQTVPALERSARGVIICSLLTLSICHSSHATCNATYPQEQTAFFIVAISQNFLRTTEGNHENKQKSLTASRFRRFIMRMQLL